MEILKNKNILVVGAHSDDEVLGVGGSILKAKANHSKVDVLIVTDSASAQYNDNEKLVNRLSNLHQCSDVLKVDNVFQWNFPDMRLDTIPHFELNKDHQILFSSLMVACRPIPNQKIKTILTYYTPSSTEWGGYEKNRNFCPNIFIDIEEYMDLKIEGLSKYTDEIRDFPHPRSLENVKNLAKYFGSQVGLRFAEPFCLIRSIDIY